MPWPRTRTAERPSSSRSRASRLGRCLREVNGGSDPDAPGTSTERCRAGEARAGPRLRTVTRSACRSPRRVGWQRGGDAGTLPPAASRAGGGRRSRRPKAATRRGAGRAPGGVPGLATSSALDAVSPQAHRGDRSRVTTSRRGPRAQSRPSEDDQATTSSTVEQPGPCRPAPARAARSERGQRHGEHRRSGSGRCSVIGGRGPAERALASTEPTVDALELGLGPQRRAGAPGWSGPAP